MINRQLVVTGVGYKEAIPTDPNSSVFSTPGIKPNMGACVAQHAAIAGYQVTIAARTSEKLERVRRSILQRVPQAIVRCHPTDVLDPTRVESLLQSLPTEPELDLVQCAGASAGSFEVQDGNFFFPIEETPLHMPTLEFETVVKSLLILVQKALPQLKKQRRSRLVVVTSMSGMRAFPMGFSHCAGKGGLHEAVRSLALELNPMGIRVCEVAPGIVNTGLYDSPAVDSMVRRISERFDYHYSPGGIPEMTPDAVADAVMLCLLSDAHVLSISLVSDGQFPHQSS